MAKNDGFFKGEKKKPKKGKDKTISGFSPSTAPNFVMPEIISKKKKNSF
jgi:hypothetical protein